MKTLCVLFFIVGAMLLCNTYAQQAPAIKAKLSDNSVVKDTSGIVYPAAIWKNLLSTGRYTLRVKDAKDENSEFLLVRLSEEEYQRRMENAPKPRESSFFTTGTNIRSFTATSIDGKKYKLKELLGKVVVLNFWFIACPPCQKEIPELNNLADEYKDSSGVVFLAICLDEEYLINKFLEKTPFRYNIIDNGRYVTSMYGINSYPTHVVLDKQGKVSFHATGYSLALIPWLRKTIAKNLE
jgi:peroxiredoxin